MTVTEHEKSRPGQEAANSNNVHHDHSITPVARCAVTDAHIDFLWRVEGAEYAPDEATGLLTDMDTLEQARARYRRFLESLTPAELEHQVAIFGWQDEQDAWFAAGCPEESRPGPEPEDPTHVAEPPYGPAYRDDAPGPVMVDALPDEIFDPAASGAFNEYDIACGVLVWARVKWRVVFDATRRVWIELDEDDNGQPVWRPTTAKAGEYAKELAVRTTQTLPKGDRESENVKDKMRAKLHTDYKKNGGLSALGALVQSLAALKGSAVHTTATLIEQAAEDEGKLWAGGRHWNLNDARQLKLRPLEHSQDVVHLRTAACAPADIPTPLWDNFLEAAFPDDEQRDFAMHLMGVAVTGISNRVFGVLWGDAGTGKTSLLKLVADVLGSYAMESPADLLDGRGDAQFEHALQDKRMAWVDEGPRSGHYAVERLKSLTGGASRSTRGLYQSAITWAPKYTLFLTSNEAPTVTDHALRSRVRSLHMEGDPNAVADAMAAIGSLNGPAWKAERPGVLAALMAHAGRYLHNPRLADNPEGAAAELEQVAHDQDPLALWMDDRITQGGETKSSDLYTDFVCFAKNIGFLNPPKLQSWGTRLTKMGHGSRKSNGNMIRPLTIRHGGLSPRSPQDSAQGLPEQVWVPGGWA